MESFYGDPTANTSGQGEHAVVPEEIQKWNWGAFFLHWIWGIGNKVWIALLTFVPFVGIVMPFVLGAKGSEWAWRNKEWESVEHFQEVQRKWAKWGIILFCIGMAFLILSLILAVAIFPIAFGIGLFESLNEGPNVTPNFDPYGNYEYNSY